MFDRPKSLLVVLLALAVVGLAQLSAPQAAHADRCNPEELIGQEPILFGPDEGPVCDLLIKTVYPSTDCDYITLRRCLETVTVGGTATRYVADVCVPTSFISQHCVLTDTPEVINRALGCNYGTSTQSCAIQVVMRREE
jgi:hypothetical protein